MLARLRRLGLPLLRLHELRSPRRLQEDLTADDVVLDVGLGRRGRIDDDLEAVEALLVLDTLEDWVDERVEARERVCPVRLEEERVGDLADLSPDLDKQATYVDPIERALVPEQRLLTPDDDTRAV